MRRKGAESDKVSLEICVINVDLLPNQMEDDPLPDEPVLTSVPLGGQVAPFLQADIFEGPVTFLPEIAVRHTIFVPLHEGAVSVRRHAGFGWHEEMSARPRVHLQPDAERVGWSWSSGARLLRLQLDKSALRRFVSAELGLIGAQSRVIGQSDLEDPQICFHAAQLEDALRDGRPGQAVVFDAVARMLLVHMARTYLVAPSSAPIGGLNGEQFAEVIAHIDARLSEPIRIHELSDLVHMSESAFLRAIKAATGETPHELLRRRRLEAVCRLLREDTLSLGQIASVAGFSDQAHLSRVFKRAYDLSPSQWRRAELQKNRLNGLVQKSDDFVQGSTG